MHVLLDSKVLPIYLRKNEGFVDERLQKGFFCFVYSINCMIFLLLT